MQVTGDLALDGTPADAPARLAGEVPAGAGRPTIAYPLEGAVFPANLWRHGGSRDADGPVAVDRAGVVHRNAHQPLDDRRVRGDSGGRERVCADDRPEVGSAAGGRERRGRDEPPCAPRRPRRNAPCRERPPRGAMDGGEPYRGAVLLVHAPRRQRDGDRQDQPGVRPPARAVLSANTGFVGHSWRAAVRRVPRDFARRTSHGALVWRQRSRELWCVRRRDPQAHRDAARRPCVRRARDLCGDVCAQPRRLSRGHRPARNDDPAPRGRHARPHRRTPVFKRFDRG